MRVHVRLALPCAATTAAHTFASYLHDRHADVSTPDPYSVTAVAPLVLLNFDRRLYSRANWVGINPVALAGTINGRAKDGVPGSTLAVTISSLRIYFFPLVLFVVAVASAKAGAPLGAWIFMAVVFVAYASLVGWLLLRGLPDDFLTYLKARL